MFRLMKNRKGTAEVIGTIMAIVILLFFFTNVYLWHDAATKQMDNMYVQKMNTPITLSLGPGNSSLIVTDKGGSDATLAVLWIDVESANGGPDIAHYFYDSNIDNIVVQAGLTYSIPLPNGMPTEKTVFTVITTLGNTASCSYVPPA